MAQRGKNTRCHVTLVLTLLNEGAALPTLLDTLIAQRRHPDEIVVVDGGSTDDTIEVLQRYLPRLPLQIHVAPGAGISRGRNLAIARARHEIIAVTDAGVRLDPHWLERLVAPFEQAAPPDMVSGFFLPDPRGRFEHALAMTTLPAIEEMGRGRFLPSARSVAFTRTLWQRLGGYPEWMTWSEDVLFDLAALASGATIHYEPGAVVHFRPRPTLAAFARQYRNYAFGDGQGLLWPKRHALRYLTYLVALPAALALSRRRPALGLPLLLFGAAVMFLTPIRRHLRQTRYRWSALPLIPLIRITGDLAKMWGFPQAVREGMKNRPRTRVYLSRTDG